MSYFSPDGLDLSSLQFGSEAANNERSALPSYFLPTDEYVAVREGRYWIIRGTKGSGKSALALQLLGQTNEQDFFIDVSPSAVGWDNLRSNTGFKSIQMKKTAWQAAFLSHALDVVLKHGWANYPLDAIDDLFRQAGIERDYNKWRLKEIAVDLKAFSVTFGADDSDRPAADYARFARAVEESLKVLDSALASDGRTMRLIIDGYDTFWENTAEDSKTIEALFLAAQDLMTYTSTIRAQVFIRNDIWHRVQWDNRDHVKTGIIDLKWDSQKLLQMIQKRIDFSLGMKSKSPWTAFEACFESIVMGVHGQPQGMHAWDFILSFTPPRPRDVIMFCEFARKERKHSGAMISQSELRRASERYSHERHDNIKAESFKTAPRLKEALESLRGAPYKMKWRAMKERLAKLDETKDELPRQMLLDLMEYEVCGVEHDGMTEYHYDNPNLGDTPVTFETVLVLHRGLRQSLNLKMPYEKKDPTSVESAQMEAT